MSRASEYRHRTADGERRTSQGSQDRHKCPRQPSRRNGVNHERRTGPRLQRGERLTKPNPLPHFLQVIQSHLKSLTSPNMKCTSEHGQVRHIPFPTASSLAAGRVVRTSPAYNRGNGMLSGFGPFATVARWARLARLRACRRVRRAAALGQRKVSVVHPASGI